MSYRSLQTRWEYVIRVFTHRIPFQLDCFLPRKSDIFRSIAFPRRKTNLTKVMKNIEILDCSGKRSDTLFVIGRFKTVKQKTIWKSLISCLPRCLTWQGSVTVSPTATRMVSPLETICGMGSTLNTFWPESCLNKT